MSRSWSEFRINFSQNAAWDLSSREHWWDLINFESILFLSNLILCVSKTVKYLACPSKWRVELTVWDVLFFPVPEEIAYSFNFFFDILELYKFGLWVSQRGNKDLVSDYIFTTRRESHSIPDMVFLLTLNYHSGLNLKPSFHKGGAWQDLKFWRRLLGKRGWL